MPCMFDPLTSLAIIVALWIAVILIVAQQCRRRPQASSSTSQ